MRGGQLVCRAAVVLALAATADARVGDSPARFSLPAAVGGPTSGSWNLADFLRKKPIAIVFWTTGCGPCEQQLQVYQELFELHVVSGLQVVAISLDDASTLAQVGPTAKRLGLTFPVLSDPGARVSGHLNPKRSTTFSVWIDPWGHIAHEREGFSPADRDVISRGIAHLVTGQR